MVLEHQTQMQNCIALANYQARIALLPARRHERVVRRPARDDVRRAPAGGSSRRREARPSPALRRRGQAHRPRSPGPRPSPPTSPASALATRRAAPSATSTSTRRMFRLPVQLPHLRRGVRRPAEADEGPRLSPVGGDPQRQGPVGGVRPPLARGPDGRSWRSCGRRKAELREYLPGPVLPGPGCPPFVQEVDAATGSDLRVGRGLIHGPDLDADSMPECLGDPTEHGQGLAIRMSPLDPADDRLLRANALDELSLGQPRTMQRS